MRLINGRSCCAQSVSIYFQIIWCCIYSIEISLKFFLWFAIFGLFDLHSVCAQIEVKRISRNGFCSTEIATLCIVGYKINGKSYEFERIKSYEMQMLSYITPQNSACIMIKSMRRCLYLVLFPCIQRTLHTFGHILHAE